MFQYFLVFALFSSCVPKIRLLQTPLSEGQLKIIPLSYTKTNYVTPFGKELITLDVVFLNYSDESFSFDADELYLFDTKDQEYRVEFISGIRHDDNGKIIWTIKGKAKHEKRVKFITDENVELAGLRLGSNKIKLLSM